MTTTQRCGGKCYACYTNAGPCTAISGGESDDLLTYLRGALVALRGALGHPDNMAIGDRAIARIDAAISTQPAPAEVVAVLDDALIIKAAKNAANGPVALGHIENYLPTWRVFAEEIAAGLAPQPAESKACASVGVEPVAWRVWNSTDEEWDYGDTRAEACRGEDSPELDTQPQELYDIAAVTKIESAAFLRGRAAGLSFASLASPAPSVGEPVTWQKKHATETEGLWVTASELDFIFWAGRPGWEVRALYATPPAAPAAPSVGEPTSESDLRLARYEGYKGEPLNPSATDAERAAWEEGRRAREPRNPDVEVTRYNVQIGGHYNWKGQPERLVYMGLCEPRNGRWHQFAKVDSPTVCWSEVTDDDLSSFEATPPAAPAATEAPSEIPGWYVDRTVLTKDELEAAMAMGARQWEGAQRALTTGGLSHSMCVGRAVEVAALRKSDLATPAPAVGASVAWENFPAYLIDHCEGDTITEEGLQFALARMLKDPQYAAVGASPEPVLTEDEFCFLERVEDTIRMFAEGRYPYDSDKAPNQKWRRATISDVEKRFKTMAPRFTALSIKLFKASAVGASVQPVPVAYSEGRTLHWHAGRGMTDAQLYAGPVQPVQASLSDEQIENCFLACGGKWNGDQWVIEDADFYPFARTFAALASSTPTNPGAATPKGGE